MKKLILIWFLFFSANIFAGEQNHNELYFVVEQKIKEYSFTDSNEKKEKICVFNSKNQLIYFCNDKSDFPVEYRRRVDFVGKIGNTEYYIIFN